MKVLFSKRHAKAIREKTITLTFSRPLRVSMLRILNQFSTYGDFSQNYTFDEMEEILKTFYGTESIASFDEQGNRVVSTLDRLLLYGYPSEVIDMVEAFFACCGSKERPKCEKELNDLLSMNNSPWRFVNGDAMLVDSDYVHTEIETRTIHLLKQGGAFGALQEFQDAVQDLLSGDTKDAIVNAHKSVESTMKCALDIDEHKRFGELLAALIKSSIIPTYYEDFLRHFEKLALGAVKERNQPARGHGQGTQVMEIPKSLAQFAVNLAATINLFILERWLEKGNKPPSGNDDEEEEFIPEISEDDIPL